MAALHAFRAGAILALLAIIGAAALYWPLPELGFATDPPTGIVLTVAPGSPAAEGGLQPGDQVVRIYTYPWEAINTRLFLVPLPWHDGTPSPLTVSRSGVTLDLTLYARLPDLPLQIDKALRTLVALVCWGTGAALGSSPRGVNRRLQVAAWFWILLGGALGVYQFVQITSYVLTVAVLWLLGTILAPAAVMMHLWYPSRPIARATVDRAQRWWLVIIGLLQVVTLGLAALGQTTAGLLALLDTGTTLAFLGSFVFSAIALGHAYRITTIAHIRRQIRLIAVACVLVACAWAALVLGDALEPALLTSVPPVTLTAITVVVPLAYLLGGISPDLMRADHVARWLVAHALTIVAILGILAGVAQSGLLTLSPMVIAAFTLAAYTPTSRLMRWLVAGLAGHDHPYALLNQAAARLGTSLDADQLASIISDGLRGTFHDPPVAIYLRRDHDDATLALVNARQLPLPQAVRATLLDEVFGHEEALLLIGTVQQRIGEQPLEGRAAALVFAPHASLWGLIRHAQGGVLGLMILGPRGDLDPYRARDRRELERLLSAAALAFTNSASYAHEVQAQDKIRQLYRRLQQTKDETEASIAREIHDEVVNVNVRLNIMALQHLVAQVVPPQLHDEIQAILESEQTTSQMLRMICERLHPADIDDPLGLVASLRRMITQTRAGWAGQVILSVDHDLVPVERQVHRELVLIAREALINAIKHADATEIHVDLQFPAERDNVLTLIIRDNGRTRQRVTPKAGHMGLSFMRESADAIGATIRWEPVAMGGTAVIVTLPAVSQSPTPQWTLTSVQDV
ncbi:MAG: ATP-binding protein [Chloroflexales bacterium]